MDIIQTQEKMRAYIKAIEIQCNKLDSLGEAEADAARNYDKAIAQAILKLQSDGQPATVTEKLAKGMCIEERFALTVAEKGYKSCVTKIDAAKACLNAWQSINRHLENV